MQSFHKLGPSNKLITGYEDNAPRDPYEESYDPAPYPQSPPAANYQQPQDNYYPATNNFAPPPASTTNLNMNTPPNGYQPAEYPPPPGAGPPNPPFNYGAPGPGTEQYAPRARRADDHVSAPKSSTTQPTDHSTHDGVSQKLAVHDQKSKQADKTPTRSSQGATDPRRPHKIHPNPEVRLLRATVTDSDSP